MSMPQVHIVAYCGDLGYGVARGADMLSLMMASGVLGRILSGPIADRIGGLRTLMLGSALQAVALFMYLLYDGFFRSMRSRRCSACFRAGSSRATRSSSASILRPKKPARASGSC